MSLGIVAASGWSVYAMFVLDRGRPGRSGLALLWHGQGGGIYLEVGSHRRPTWSRIEPTGAFCAARPG